MKTNMFLAVMVIGIAYVVGLTVFHEACNEDKCVSRVSQCQLTGACGCTLENCTCCINCTLCLSELWDDCCACVGMCKPRNLSATDISSYSTVGHLQRSQDWTDTLFKALTMGKPMPGSHWTVDRVTPEEEGVNVGGLLGSINPAVDASGTKIRPSATAMASANETISDDDCMVAYVNVCLGLEKCEAACHHMGAAKYRWFHTGCCECIGKPCHSYGKNKALCSECPND